MPVDRAVTPSDAPRAEFPARWGRLATPADFGEREDLWEYCQALQRFLSAEVQRFSLDVEGESYPAGDVSVVYVANPAVNALAGAWAGGECIAIFAGVALRLMDVAHAVLSHPALMPSIGDARSEQGSDASLRAAFLPATRSAARGPSDERRRAYAAALSVIGVHYVFVHELAHLVLGHVGYVGARQADRSDEGSANVFLEYSQTGGGHSLEKRLLRFIEFEADTAAVTVSLPFVLDVLPAVALNPFRESQPARVEFMTLWATAVGLVYTLLHHANPSSQSHPPPIPRYYNAMMLGSSVAAQTGEGDEQDEFGDAATHAHAQLSRVWSIARTEPAHIRWMKKWGWRRSVSSIVTMDDDVPEEQQREWHELARARADRLRAAERKRVTFSVPE
jgi:hypothetical protein